MTSRRPLAPRVTNSINAGERKREDSGNEVASKSQFASVFRLIS